MFKAVWTTETAEGLRKVHLPQSLESAVAFWDELYRVEHLDACRWSSFGLRSKKVRGTKRRRRMFLSSLGFEEN